MNSGPMIFLAAFFALAFSWTGFVLAPQLQIGSQQIVATGSGDLYPSMRSGQARQGEQIYKANGCFYCHSQQVRPKGFGSDVERGWGGRNGVVQSVDQDYLYDRPVMLGTQRVGPDLANFGLRQPNQTNLTLLLLHLYNPRLTMPGSVMPPHRFLFQRRPIAFGAQPSDDALPISTETAAGYEVVPTQQALALAAYLMSLRSQAVLFETPPFPPKTNAFAAAQTNAPVAANTNAPAK